jgi:hypothetical protein
MTLKLGEALENMPSSPIFRGILNEGPKRREYDEIEQSY